MILYIVYDILYSPPPRRGPPIRAARRAGCTHRYSVLYYIDIFVCMYVFVYIYIYICVLCYTVLHRAVLCYTVLYYNNVMYHLLYL